MAEENNHHRSNRTGRGRRSEYWQHFEQKAECKYCKALLCADPVKDGTSRLKKHYEETCPVRHPKPMPARQQDSPAAPVQERIHNLQNVSTISNSNSDNSGQQTAVVAEHQLLRLIALHGFPSYLVEDMQFLRFIHMICPDFKTPLRDDVQKRCDALFDQEMSSLKDALGCMPGLLSLSLGEAETAWGKVVYLAVHFIDDKWNFCSRVIQVFKALYDGGIAYDGILDIKDYWCDIPADVSCNFDKLMGTISRWSLLPKFSGVLTESFFTQDFGKKLYNDNHLQHLSETKHKLLRGTDILRDFNLVARLLTGESEFAWNEQEFAYKESFFRPFRDEKLKKKQRDISSHLILDHPWAYYEWWYVSYYALEIIHNECSSASAQIEALREKVIFHETPITELLRKMVGATYRAIRTVSASNSPTSNLVLIELLKLQRTLVSEHSNASRRNEDTDDEQSSEEEDVLESVQRAKDELLAVFLKSFLSLSIPLILDPRFKLDYVESILKNACLHADDISKVGEEFHKLFMEYYNEDTETQQSNERNDMENTNHVSEMDVDPSQHGYASTWRLVDQLGMEQNNTSSQESWKELGAYLQDETVPMEGEDFAVLKWWKDNCDKYPTVARMARDFLAVPTSNRPSPQMMIEITNHLRRYA